MKLQRALASVLVYAFLTLAVYGMFMMSERHHHDHCPFSPGMAICLMSELDHMTLWRTLMSVAPVLFMIGALVALALWVFSLRWYKTDLTAFRHIRLRNKYTVRPASLLLRFTLSPRAP